MPLHQFSIEQDRKDRGAFFTPPELVEFMVGWAIRSPKDKVLEPSCGEAAFLLELAKRLEPGTLSGLDIHADSISHADRVLSEHGLSANLKAGDFFFEEATAEFDAVVGNPPYVRYQNFSGRSRLKSIEVAADQGVKLNQLASSWAAFVVHCAAFLKPDGRLALVLPGELMAVKYAAQIRRFLLDRFKSVRLVVFESRVFPGVLEEVVLLLAEGEGGGDRFEIFQAKDASCLATISKGNWTVFTPKSNDKWTGALLPSGSFDLYNDLLRDQAIEKAKDWGSVYLGSVTGNNDFFTLTAKRASLLGIPKSDLKRISPPGSKHLRGMEISDAAWKHLAANDEKCYLFSPSANPSDNSISYIELGEKEGVNKAYKCMIRAPWWRVPLVEKADFFYTYMNHDRPKIIRNSASLHHLNSVYGFKLRPPRRDAVSDLLQIAYLNSLTLLGAEIIGRSYGGGMLKHEPTEAEELPLPSFETLKHLSADLDAVRPQVGNLLRKTDSTDAVQVVDSILLQKHMGLSAQKITQLQNARQMLYLRRMARGGKATKNVKD